MCGMRVCLFEDRPERLEPLSLTRPVFHLLCGRYALAEKLLRYLSPRSGKTLELGVLVRPHLQDFVWPAVGPGKAAVRVNDMDWLRAGTTLFVNGRWLPEGEVQLFGGPCVGVCDGEVAFVVVEQQQVANLRPLSLSDSLNEWANTLSSQPVGGAMIRYPWDLVEHNSTQLGRDYAAMLEATRQGRALQPTAPETLGVIGPSESVWVEAGARIEPYVVADATKGPVIIDAHAVVTAFSRVEGPCYIGPHSQVHGAKIRGGTTLGPQCRVGGEVEASIVHGNSNKYHEGFLGHSYIGEWVNLGAGTHNSDLRNDYGEVTVTIHGQPIPTGQTKVGCFLGDHTKTGLGTLINTGTSVGAFCNLLPAGRLAPKYVPSFTSWWNGALREGPEMDELLNTARQVMNRRGAALSDSHAALYTFLRQETAAERRRVIWDHERRAASVSDRRKSA
jgi:UDP-N-acetylglucosamine diphosphorylase/glucosamine-1-phosphate N-acetyltransferase